MVYDHLFGDDSSKESKKIAFEYLTIWKLRRSNLTPASILSTLALLEVEIKDENDSSKISEITTMYFSSFTKFINYMSSITQNKQFKTMYESAKTLGLDAFMIDLRHLCAHGQQMPSLDVFRRSSTYCMKWLKEFYWDRAVVSMSDVTGSDIQLRNNLNFENEMKKLVKIYDSTTQLIHKGSKYIEEISGTNKNSFIVNYSKKSGKPGLQIVIRDVLKDISILVKKEKNCQESGQIFCSYLLNSKYFLISAGTSNEENLTLLHQSLFRQMASLGFVKDCFLSLIEICENPHELSERCKGAAFWANKIVEASMVFKEFKQTCKNDRETDPTKFKNIQSINAEIMGKEIRKVYKRLGIKGKNVLIFGDSIKKPFELNFTKDYILERVLNINEFTEDLVDSCLKLVEPSLNDSQIETINELIKMYRSNNDEQMKSKDNKIYTLNRDVLKLSEDVLMEDKKFGIWKKSTMDVDWKSCPIGTVFK